MKTVLSIKMDAKLKKDIQRTAQEVGLPMSLVFSNLGRGFVQDRSLTFRAPEIPNKKTARILKEIEKDSKLGRNFVGPFSTEKEIRDYFKSL
ncbi:MAG TPA: hypothetical protein VJJ22_04080 [Candidatus Paceibacterota bacterium]